jgi:hypothetical protein
VNLSTNGRKIFGKLEAIILLARLVTKGLSLYTEKANAVQLRTLFQRSGNQPAKCPESSCPQKTKSTSFSSQARSRTKPVSLAVDLNPLSLFVLITKT